MRNLQRQSLETTIDSPEQLPVVALTAVPAASPETCAAPRRAIEATSSEENVWEVWPYCWATSGWDKVADGFHSFHENLAEWRLARANRRTREKFQSEFWQNWNNRPEREERELRLV